MRNVSAAIVMCFTWTQDNFLLTARILSCPPLLPSAIHALDQSFLADDKFYQDCTWHHPLYCVVETAQSVKKKPWPQNPYHLVPDRQIPTRTRSSPRNRFVDIFQQML